MPRSSLGPARWAEDAGDVMEIKSAPVDAAGGGGVAELRPDNLVIGTHDGVPAEALDEIKSAGRRDDGSVTLMPGGFHGEGAHEVKSEGEGGDGERKAVGTDDPVLSAMQEIKRNVEGMRSGVEARIAALEAKGASVDPLLRDELKRIDDAIQGQISELRDLQAKAARPPIGAGGDEAGAKELKSFNDAAESLARANNRAFAPLDPGEFTGYKSAFLSYATKGDRSLSSDEVKSLQVAVDADGGFLVPAEMEAAIDRVVGEMGAMRQLATVRQTSAGSWKKVVSLGGATTAWAGERTRPADTATPRLDEIEIMPGKLMADPRATGDIIEDSPRDVAAWLEDEVALKFAEAEGQAFIDGDGVKKPRGILSYPIVAEAAYDWGSIGYVATGAAGAFDTGAGKFPGDALITLRHALNRKYRPGAQFLMNDATLATVRKLKDGQGNYLWQPNFQEALAGSLLGSPVAIDDFMPDIGADRYAIAFGDFRRAYTILDRRGITVLRDPYSDKPYITFFTTKRVGGAVTNFEALKLLKFAAA